MLCLDIQFEWYSTELLIKCLTNASFFSSCHSSQYSVRPLWSTWRLLAPQIEPRRRSAPPGVFIFRSQVSHSAPRWDFWRGVSLFIKSKQDTNRGKRNVCRFSSSPAYVFFWSSSLSLFCLPELINKMCLVCSAACVQYPLKGPTSTSLSMAHVANWQSYPSLQQGPTPTIKSHSNHRADVTMIRGRHLEKK